MKQMKNLTNKNFFNKNHSFAKFNFIKLFAMMIFSIALFASCYTPAPIYGKWADNEGNQISFNSDGTYMATIKTDGKPQSYEGNFQIIENVMIFTTSDNLNFNGEWDLRGSILYFTWRTDDGVERVITLYHTAK